MTDENIEELRFDEALDRLEALAGELEDGDVPLEESLRVYEQAVALFRHCRTRLGSVEQKLEILTRDLDGDPVAAPLDTAQDDDG
ncbi:MAG: exodeoxyribonuclease VII small subunit [Acidobacteria bacterium]|nr:exodeoxyribonuclease VII small subunit [Acidobacteriota bacterium]